MTTGFEFEDVIANPEQFLETIDENIVEVSKVFSEIDMSTEEFYECIDKFVEYARANEKTIYL